MSILRGAADKLMVVGAIEVLARRKRKERVGRLRLQVVADGSVAALVGFVANNVGIGSVVKTDGFISHDGLTEKCYMYEVVKTHKLEHIHKTFGN